QNAHPSPK
uniref:Bradykinin-potentiating peptide 8a n=1 Tax=Bothrops cotiara TaxID=8727 RepID=BPP8A_BOTCO|nr:RecName: Full=Bradykinin-potentiating peptide 8a; Short=BPP-8a [Bothrops cotiara]